MRTFYLGTHKPGWLWNPACQVPLCVSYNTLRHYKNFRPSGVPWMLDSGGFTELTRHGREAGRRMSYVTISARGWAEFTARCAREIGNLDFASPQDWMNEPDMIWGGMVGKVRAEGTGLSHGVHVLLTVHSYVELINWWPQFSDDPCPFIPVLQGWTLGHLEYCREAYIAAGVDLASARAVGLGSVCRRSQSLQIAAIAGWFASYGYKLHGFGVKTDGLDLYGQHLHSADSAAWSYDAYRARRPLFAGHTHQTCSNCLDAALAWREHVVNGGPRLVPPPLAATAA